MEPGDIFTVASRIIPLPPKIGTFKPVLGDVGLDWWGRPYIWQGEHWITKNCLPLDFIPSLFQNSQN